MSKFDAKVSAIPNGLEKYMAFTVNKNLVFIDSMQFMNLGLDSLVKNLSDNDFQYLSEEFSGKFQTIFKFSNKKECIHMSIWTTLKSFMKINCLINLSFLVL